MATKSETNQDSPAADDAVVKAADPVTEFPKSTRAQKAAKSPTRSELSEKMASAHLALEEARQLVIAKSLEIDELIRQLNNTPEDLAEAPTVTR